MLVHDVWGRDGRPVVLLHGLLFDRTMWWPAAAELAAAGPGTVVAPDLPGHGESPPRGECRLDDVAAEIADIVHALGRRQAPIIVGHATSAQLATTFAGTYATHHVVTLDEPPPGTTGLDDLLAAARPDTVPAMLRHYAQPRRDPALLTAYRSWLAQPPTRRNQPALAGRAPGRPPAEATFAPLTDPQGFARQLRLLL